ENQRISASILENATYLERANVPEMGSGLNPGNPRGSVSGLSRGRFRTLRITECYSITANSQLGNGEWGDKRRDETTERQMTAEIRKDMKNRTTLLFMSVVALGVAASNCIASPTLLALRSEAGTSIYGGSTTQTIETTFG